MKDNETTLVLTDEQLGWIIEEAYAELGGSLVLDPDRQDMLEDLLDRTDAAGERFREAVLPEYDKYANEE